MHTHVRPAIRRLATAVLIAAAATSGVNPATASAEWDIGQYDNCIDNVNNADLAGDITPDVRDGLYVQCCRLSGGVPDGGVLGGCGAPPAVAASNTPRPGAPAANADPDVDTSTGTGPKPTKNPPRLPTAPAPGANDDGSGSGSGGGQNDSPVG